jgi:hypothetical protein
MTMPRPEHIINGAIRVDYRVGGETRYYLSDPGVELVQVPPEVTTCVCFVGYKDATGIHPAGTAFFVGYPVEGIADRHFVHLVTAKHVLDGIKNRTVDGGVYLRLNFKGRGSDWVRTTLSQWYVHPADPFLDVAVLLDAPIEDIDYLAIPLSMTATDEVIASNGIGVGDEVFMTGLFVGHQGRGKNEPIVRVGNIAAMPEEPVQTRWDNNYVQIKAYLVEARSIGGLSGSPVFVHLGVHRWIEGGVKVSTSGPHFYWLGLMHGHWDQRPPTSSPFYHEAVNMGIGIVIPVSKVLEVMAQPEVAELRKRVAEELRRRLSPTPDIPAAQDSEITKEEFEQALRRASRRIKPPQRDEASPPT